MGDLAGLVAPEHVVLCEGRPAQSATDSRAAFDASCHTSIFRTEFSNTDFISVGNSHDVGEDRLEFGKAIQGLVSGTRVTRVIDRDFESPEEVSGGVRVLTRRHIEAYLLDDEVIAALCRQPGQPELLAQALHIKVEEIEASTRRGRDQDDLKSAAGSIYSRLRMVVGLTGAGSNFQAFARGTPCPPSSPEHGNVQAVEPISWVCDPHVSGIIGGATGRLVTRTATVESTPAPTVPEAIHQGNPPRWNQRRLQTVRSVRRRGAEPSPPAVRRRAGPDQPDSEGP